MGARWVAMYYADSTDKLPSHTEFFRAETADEATEIAARDLNRSPAEKVDIALVNVYTTITK
jgi:hypothetical protein